MKLDVQLMLREHQSGFFTVEVVGQPDLVVFTDDVERAKEELELVLTDRIERSHPTIQSKHATPLDLELTPLEVRQGIRIEAHEETRTAPIQVSALVSKHRSWTMAWLPRVDVRIFTQGSWPAELAEVARRTLQLRSDHHRLAVQAHRREWIEKLELSVRPPVLSAFVGKHWHLDMLPEPSPDPEEQPKDPRGKKRIPTPTLEKVGLPMTRLAEDGELERAFGRDREVSALTEMLTKKGNAVVAVVGDSGCGKTTLLNEVVHRLRGDREVWFVDAGRLVAQDGWGGWQRRSLDVVEEVEQAHLVWYVGALLPLLDAGKHIGSDHNVSMLLKPPLSARRITVVGESSTDEWAQLELRDVGFARCFVPYRLDEPAEKDTQLILTRTAELLEAERDVLTTHDALDAVLELCRRYAHQRSRLGTAVHFLRRAVERTAALEKSRLDRRGIVDCFCHETGLPELVVRDDLPLDPEQVRAQFERRVIGQSEAVARMVDLIAVIKAGLSDLEKPLGSFLFVGPTGVGKTEMAKALAEFLFGSSKRLIRFDMSEYVGADAIQRFLGDRGTEGKLVEAIRRAPFSVVLLDEIEKAHPTVFDVLLQVLGEGRLTDESGRVASFANAVVVMTSNLGVDTYKRPVGFGEGGAAPSGHFVEAAERFFRPELFNRIDHVVPFLSLDAAQIAGITRREIDKFLRREGLRQRDVRLQIDDEVLAWLCERGTDPRYGARPLKREIERNLAAPLARRLSKGKASAVSVAVSVGDDELLFGVEEVKKKAKAQRSQGAIEAVEVLLHRHRLLERSDVFQELDQQVRLLSQLSSSKRFWANRKLAEARTRDLAAEIELVEAAQAHRSALESLADLAYGAFFAAEDDDPLQEDLARLQSGAKALELRLFARGFTPNVATLYLEPTPAARPFERSLLEAYVAIAERRKWDFDFWIAEAADDQKRPRNSREGVWRWRELPIRPANPLDPPNIAKALNAIQERPPATLAAIAFRGEYAGALLSSESGWHAEGSSSQEQVRVRVTYANRAGAHPHPRDIGAPNGRRRTFDRRRRIVEDHHLGHQRALDRMSRIMTLYVDQVPARGLFGARNRDYYDAVGW